VALAGQQASAGNAGATARTHRSHLCWHDLRLKRRNELLRLGEPKSKLRQPSFLIALDASHLGLRHHTRAHFRHQLHPPNQLRHQTNPLPVSPEPSPIAAGPQDFECSLDVLAAGSISRIAGQRSNFRHLMSKGGGDTLLESIQRKASDLPGGPVA
jgi:hypothetical protein